MAPVVLMVLLPTKEVQTVGAGFVTLVLPGITARLVVRTARRALGVLLQLENLDITTGEKLRVGRTVPAALVVLDPMPSHMVQVGHKVAGKSPKADLDQVANKKSTTR